MIYQRQKVNQENRIRLMLAVAKDQIEKQKMQNQLISEEDKALNGFNAWEKYKASRG